MKEGHKILLYGMIMFITVSVSCRKPYVPPAISAPNSYLVVEGVIDAGSDTTFIKLSRTVKLSSKNTLNPVVNATVAVQGDQNVSYPLTYLNNGIYAFAGLNLDNSHKYRLYIQTPDGKQYVSDYQAVLNSPPIDSVTFDAAGSVAGAGMNVYVNTHDPNNSVKYFRWDYDETWEYNSAFYSYFKSNGDTVLDRDIFNDNIYFCWRRDTSSNLVLGTSAKLTKSIISHNLLTSIPSGSEKVGLEYSILVRQYALTVDAYNFYTNLKKNTEQLGSIFDAQPSEISGNIHSVTDPNEPVIGYISVGSISKQRIFVLKSQLPFWTIDPSPYAGCQLAGDPTDPAKGCCYFYNVEPDGAIDNQVNLYINYNYTHLTNPLIPINIIQPPGRPPLGYTAGERECVDCTLRGTNKKPSYWK